MISLCLFLELFFLSLPNAVLGDEPLESEERFPMTHSSALLLPAKAFDEEFVFLVDTGAGGTVFDAGLRPRLGPVVGSVSIHSIVGKREIDLFASPEIRYGHDWKMSVRESVGTLDLGFLKRILMTENVGVSGTDFLQSRILLIHFDEKYFQFPSEPKLQRTHAERFTIKQETPRILVRVPDIGFKSFVLDTGSTHSIGLDSDTFDQLVQKHKITLTGETLSSNGSVNAVSARSGFLESFDLGEHRFHDVFVHETSRPELGMNFFRRFNVEFDFPRQVVRFQPGKTIDRKDRKIRFGFKPSLEHRDKLIIESTTESGPAAKAGLQKGDELLSLNGINAMRFFADSALNGGMILDLEDDQVPVRFKRDGVERDVIVTIEVLTNAFSEKPAHEIIESTNDF